MENNFDTKIQFSGLKPGCYEYEYRFDGAFFSRFENDDLRECSVDFKVKLERKERLLAFDLSFEGETVLECDRCLEKMRVPLQGEASLFVKFGEAKECDNEDVVYLPDGESEIDLAQWMYEYVAVAVPMVHIHPDDEQGNPTCDPAMMKYINTTEQEDNHGTDPRWDALKKLKDE